MNKISLDQKTICEIDLNIKWKFYHSNQEEYDLEDIYFSVTSCYT